MTHSPLQLRMGSAEWTMLVVLSILWGGSFLFVGVAVKELPPLTIVLARVALAAAALHLVLRASGLAVPRDPRVWRACLWMGLLNNAVPFTLIAWGQTHIESGLASIYNATTPLFTVIVAHVMTEDEKATPRKLAGVVIGFAGVAVMMGGALRAVGVDVLAQLAMLIAAVSYAVSGVYGRRFRALGVPPLATAAGMLTASSVMLLPVALFVDRPWTLPWPSGAAAASVAALALASTALGYLLYFRVLARAGATNLLLVTFLIPVSAILLGTTLLDERLAPRHFLGMALIGLGLVAIDGRLVDRLKCALTARPRNG